MAVHSVDSVNVSKNIVSKSNNQTNNVFVNEFDVDVDSKDNLVTQINSNGVAEMDFSDMSLDNNQNLLEEVKRYDGLLDKNRAESDNLAKQIEIKKRELEAVKDIISPLELKKKAVEIEKLEVLKKEKDIEGEELANSKREIEKTIMDKPIELKTLEELIWEKDIIDKRLKNVNDRIVNDEYSEKSLEKEIDDINREIASINVINDIPMRRDKLSKEKSVLKNDIKNVRSRLEVYHEKKYELLKRKAEIDNQINKLESIEQNGTQKEPAPRYGYESQEGHSSSVGGH